MPTLPDVTARFKVDYSDLSKAERASAKAHGEFQAGAKASTTHNLRFQESLTTMMGHFAHLPPVADTAARSLESMGSQGVSSMTMLGGAAVAGAGIVAAVLGESIKKYTELADEVENYKRVTGSSAEESSRMVEAFKALGVSSETATGAMFKLSKAVDQHPAKLVALGIEVAHEKNGNVDLAKTLENTADAYNATGDASKKNAILLLAFGKTGKDMIPVLEQGSAALRQLEQAAGLVFSDADLERVKQMEIQNRQVKQSFDAMIAGLGQNFIPVMGEVSREYLKGKYEEEQLNKALEAGTITRWDMVKANSGLGGAAAGLTDKWGAEFEASRKVTGAIDAQAQASQKLLAENDAVWASTDKLITQDEAQVNAGFALQRANMTVAESQGKVQLAQEAYDAAFKKFGPQADETLLALNNLRRSYIDQEAGYYSAAAAARKLQQDTDLATTGQKDAAKETQAYVAKLQEEADALGPDSPLRIRLQAYIDKLKDEIPKDVYTNLHVGMSLSNFAGKALDDAIPHYASGGRPQVGVPAMFGERGTEIWTPDVPGTVTSHGQAPPASASEVGNGELVGLLQVIAATGAAAEAHLADIAGRRPASAQTAAWRLG
jgi:hypothetical protein